MPNILIALYLLLMVAAGWRLFTMGWTRAMKMAAAVLLVMPLPMLFLLPGLMNPERPFADMLRAIGLALAGGGGLSLMGGMVGAWLKARRA
ncbi:hypothetical protein [Sphingobium vermicomposti]|uniref:Uncharacterized protein n=1 Tax=Sphingobium vermicomposti TaxID=529005 RepID=A0A846M8X5_9SPHN|nr:hypothetical protein [Sphingobium vermicomposti]NIJ17191.1 hypothetical protein [Sphingobium vermicomposti]